MLSFYYILFIVFHYITEKGLFTVLFRLVELICENIGSKTGKGNDRHTRTTTNTPPCERSTIHTATVH